MSAFKMQVGCSCADIPSAMDCIDTWDGPDTPAMVEGRRYVWECVTCKNRICINMVLFEEVE